MPLVHPTTGKILFSDAEMRSQGNGEIRLAAGFGEALVEFRVAFAQPMAPTSFCRDPDHNHAEGGHPSSAHLTHNPRWLDAGGKPLGTFGLDVAIPDSQYRARLVETAFMFGWCVGINFSKGFVHLDKRLDYTDKVGLRLFGY